MGLPPSTHLTCIPISLGQCKCVVLFSSHRHAPHDIGPSTRPCLYASRLLHLQVITAFGTPVRICGGKFTLTRSEADVISLQHSCSPSCDPVGRHVGCHSAYCPLGDRHTRSSTSAQRPSAGRCRAAYRRHMWFRSGCLRALIRDSADGFICSIPGALLYVISWTSSCRFGPTDSVFQATVPFF
jgi:hypothetical protein